MKPSPKTQAPNLVIARYIDACPFFGAGSVMLIVVMLNGVWSESVTDRPVSDIAQVLMPLVLGGTILISAMIALDCWAGEKMSARGGNFRTALAISTFVALTFLTVWVTAQAERNRVSYAGELVVFMCLPVLFVCAPLLWFSAQAIQRTPQRLLMLTVFVSATALVELHCLNADDRNWEEKVFMVHSLLIALALALRLGTWWYGGGSRSQMKTGA